MYMITEAKLTRLLAILARIRFRVAQSPFVDAILADADVSECFAALDDLKKEAGVP